MAVFPVLSLAAGCYFEVRLQDIVWSLASSVLLAGMVWQILRWLGFRNGRDALAASCFVILFFGYRMLRDTLQLTVYRLCDAWLPASVVLVLWLLLLAGALAYLRFGRIDTAALGRMFQVGSVVLLATVAVNFAVAFVPYALSSSDDSPVALAIEEARLDASLAAWQNRYGMHGAIASHSQPDRVSTSNAGLLTLAGGVNLSTRESEDPPAEAAATVQDFPGQHGSLQTLPAGPQRDVYYLVFDRYAGEQTLANHFEHDNRPFLDALRQRGFVVADQSRTNYPQTTVEMAAVFNLGYHGPAVAPYRYYAGRVAEQRVATWFKQQGYRYGHFGNWHQAFRNHPLSDVAYRHGALPSEFGEALCTMTPLSQWLPLPGKAAPIVEQFTALEQFALQSPGPKFAYAHFLLPHPPFVFDADGTPVPDRVACRRSPAESYRRQLIFTNRRLLQLIDRLQTISPRPIIIVQSDEGPYLSPADESLPRREQLAKRFEILSAYYLPGLENPASAVPRDLSPVNTFRLVLREYFGVPLNRLPDRSFHWDHSTPEGAIDWQRRGQFIDVTELLREPAVNQPRPNGDNVQ